MRYRSGSSPSRVLVGCLSVSRHSLRKKSPAEKRGSGITGSCSVGACLPPLLPAPLTRRIGIGRRWRRRIRRLFIRRWWRRRRRIIGIRRRRRRACSTRYTTGRATNNRTWDAPDAQQRCGRSRANSAAHCGTADSTACRIGGRIRRTARTCKRQGREKQAFHHDITYVVQVPSHKTRAAHLRSWAELAPVSVEIFASPRAVALARRSSQVESREGLFVAAQSGHLDSALQRRNFGRVR